MKTINFIIMVAFILSACVPVATPAVTAPETAALPAGFETEAVTETAAPPASFPAETLEPPDNIASSHPDFSHPEAFQNVAFTEGITVQLTGEKPAAEQLALAGLPEDVAKAYADNIARVQDKAHGGSAAKVFYTSDYMKTFVLVGGPQGVAVIAAGNTYSYHPNAEWFSFQPAEAPAYTWVDPGVPFDQIVGGYVGEYPVWGIANQKETGALPSSVFAPDSGEFVPLVEPFRLDSVGLSAEQLAAMKKHAGLEASITAAEGGKYTVLASVYNNEGLPGALAMEVLPATMHENIDLKNDLGNTPVMQTADGKTLYWIQEKGAWYEMQLSADIDNPVKIPFKDRIVATRIVIAHFNEPFSQQALDQWKTSPGISLLLEYVDTSGKKIAYLSSKSMIGDGITMEERTVIPLDVWFESSIPDNGSPTGTTTYRYYYSKWLNPVDNNNPNGNEWMVIPHAIGPEIMNDDTNRAKLDNLLNLVENGEPVNASVPIFIFDPGFFDTTGNFITLSVPQPSLEKLKNQPGNNPSALGFISDVNNQAINGGWGPNNVLMEWLYGQQIPSDIQTMLIPTLVVHR